MTFNLPNLSSVLHQITKDRKKSSPILDDLFYDLERYFSSPNKEPRFYSQINVSERNSKYHICLYLPKVNKKDIDVQIDNNIITIRGKKQFDKEHNYNHCHIYESYYEDFRRAINLPVDSDIDTVETSFKDGVLQIMVSKSANSHVKSIEIKE